MNCWKCSKQVSEMPIKIGFRMQCSHCDTDLHTCLGCRYHSPGKPNDCLVPGTEWIKTRAAMNYCEEFSPKLSSQPSFKDDAKERARKLFGLEEEKPKKLLFED